MALAHLAGASETLSWAAVATPLLLAALVRLAARSVPRAAPVANDPLTGLPTRPALIAALQAHLAEARPPPFCAVLVVDLDGFHRINECWGRDAGDRVLCKSAQRIQAAIRPEDLVVRLEADAFAVLLAPARHLTVDAAHRIADRLVRALSESLVIDGRSVYPSASAGLATSSDAPDPDGMITAAERAMVAARGHGSATLQIYSAALEAQSREIETLAAAVSGALDRGEIQPWFQPQFAADGKTLIGLEALARWHHPERGVLVPGVLLPAIATAGRHERLSEVILEAALAALAAWNASGAGIPQVSVNFGPDELRRPGLPDRVEAALKRHNLMPAALGVEVLESVAARPADDIVVRNVQMLATMGCHIDLDDFGTGEAPISAIRRFQAKRLKIDRSFVRGIDHDPEQERMVRALIMLAEELGLETIAEGVESHAEQSVLAALGCTGLQGFGLARPMPLADATEWVHARRAATPPETGHLSPSDLPIRPQRDCLSDR